MSGGKLIFHEPKYVPTKWLIFSLGLIGGAFGTGLYINRFDSRVTALEVGHESFIKERGTTDERVIRRLDMLQESVNEVKVSVGEIKGSIGVKR